MTTSKAYKALSEVVAVDLGFCGSIKDGKTLHVDDFLPEQGSVTVDQYVDWVFQAEQIDLSKDTHLRWYEMRKKIKSAFIEHMGSANVDVSMIRKL